MRESIRGYSDAAIEAATGDGTLGRVADELAGFRALLEANEDLRGALSDPGLSFARRRAIVDDLLGARVAPATLGTIGYAMEVDRAPDVVDDVTWLAARAAQLRRRHEAGRAEPPEMPVGRTASRERLDGYATGVLERVTESGALGEVEDELFRFARVVEGSEELRAVLTDRAVPGEARAKVVVDLLGDKVHPASLALARYAALSGSPRDFVGLVDWLVDRAAAEANRRVAEVRAAAELDEDQRRRLAEALGRLTGRTVEVRVSRDPALLGGFVATIGDTVVDGSVRHRLDLLRERLIMPDVNISPTRESS